MSAALVAFLHHFAAFTIFAALVVELVLIRGEFSVAVARKLLRADQAYGIAALAILVLGACRVAWLEKTPAYYAHSATFIAKMALFAAIGLISIWPTVKMLSWRKALAAGQLPVLEAGVQRRLAFFIHLELGLLALVILCAALMAKGVGAFA